MSDLDQRFKQAAQDVQQLADEPDNNVKLRLYALYKQATEGDIRGEKPGFFDFVGTAKYEAWEKLKGMDADEARRQYIAQVERLTG